MLETMYNDKDSYDFEKLNEFVSKRLRSTGPKDVLTKYRKIIIPVQCLDKLSQRKWTCVEADLIQQTIRGPQTEVHHFMRFFQDYLDSTKSRRRSTRKYGFNVTQSPDTSKVIEEDLQSWNIDYTDLTKTGNKSKRETHLLQTEDACAMMRLASEIPSAFNFNTSSKKKGGKLSKKKQQS